MIDRIASSESWDAETRLRAAAPTTCVVVGFDGSDSATRALLGSTAENVLWHAPCDVLVVV